MGNITKPKDGVAIDRERDLRAEVEAVSGSKHHRATVRKGGTMMLQFHLTDTNINQLTKEEEGISTCAAAYWLVREAAIDYGYVLP